VHRSINQDIKANPPTKRYPAPVNQPHLHQLPVHRRHLLTQQRHVGRPPIRLQLPPQLKLPVGILQARHPALQLRNALVGGRLCRGVEAGEVRQLLLPGTNLRAGGGAGVEGVGVLRGGLREAAASSLRIRSAAAGSPNPTPNPRSNTQQSHHHHHHHPRASNKPRTCSLNRSMYSLIRPSDADAASRASDRAARRSLALSARAASTSWRICASAAAARSEAAWAARRASRYSRVVLRRVSSRWETLVESASICFGVAVMCGVWWLRLLSFFYGLGVVTRIKVSVL